MPHREILMALNGVEWAVLHSLKSESQDLEYKCSMTHWNMEHNEISIVKEWMKRRIEELENKKDE